MALVASGTYRKWHDYLAGYRKWHAYLSQVARLLIAVAISINDICASLAQHLGLNIRLSLRTAVQPLDTRYTESIGIPHFLKRQSDIYNPSSTIVHRAEGHADALLRQA